MGGEEMNRYVLFFVGLGLASTLLEAEDLGQKFGSYLALCKDAACKVLAHSAYTAAIGSCDAVCKNP